MLQLTIEERCKSTTDIVECVFMAEREVLDQSSEQDSNVILSEMKHLNRDLDQLCQAEEMLLQRLQDLEQDEKILRDVLSSSNYGLAANLPKDALLMEQQQQRAEETPITHRGQLDILKNLQDALMCDDSSSSSDDSNINDGSVEEELESNIL